MLETFSATTQLNNLEEKSQKIFPKIFEKFVFLKFSLSMKYIRMWICHSTYTMKAWR